MVRLRTPVCAATQKLSAAAAPSVANCAPSIAGWVFQVILSAQLLLVMRLNTPPLVESLVMYRRSLAELMLVPAGRPVTVKRMNAFRALLVPPTIEKVLDVPLAAVWLDWLTKVSASAPKLNVAPPVAPVVKLQLTGASALFATSLIALVSWAV